MADVPVVHMGENSPEHVAYQLLQHVAHLEESLHSGKTEGWTSADRKWIPDTYAECLLAVKVPSAR